MIFSSLVIIIIFFTFFVVLRKERAMGTNFFKEKRMMGYTQFRVISTITQH